MTKTSRIYGLDGARALLLIGGPLVHSGLGAKLPISLNLIIDASHLFRMAAFFTISGFLIALNPAASQVTWLKTRARQLLVPLASVGVLLGLLKMWSLWYAPTSTLTDMEFPLHLWFLIALALASPVMVGADVWGWSGRITVFFDKHPKLFVPTVALLLIMTRAFSSVVNQQLHAHHITPSVLAVTFFEHTPRHLVFYAMGFFLYRSKNVLQLLDHWITVAVGPLLMAIALGFYYTHFDLLQSDPAESLTTLTNRALVELTNVAMSISVIVLALRVKNVHSWILKFSSASYTVYLFHVLIIDIVAYVTQARYPQLGAQSIYWSQVIISLVVSYGIHLVIKRSWFLLFLFNGRKL
jgi:glucan biosynthesis protein C